MIVGTQCKSGRTLNTDSGSDSWRSRKTLLAEFGVESEEMNNTQVVENFDIFPASIYTQLYDKRSTSNDRWKSGGAAGNSCF
jgi:hypothetical protein